MLLSLVSECYSEGGLCMQGFCVDIIDRSAVEADPVEAEIEACKGKQADLIGIGNVIDFKTGLEPGVRGCLPVESE